MKVVIAGDFPNIAKESIIKDFPKDWDIKIVSSNELKNEISTANVLIPEHIRVNAELLEQAPNLKLVQTGAGFDNVNIEDCTRYGVQVCNAAGVNANAVAEHVMAFILCWYKNITYLDRFLKEKRRGSELDYEGAELSDKTIGILGLGNVGRKVAEYCNSFNMRVLGYSYKPLDIDKVEQRNLDSLYRESDIISIHIPLKEETRHIIDANVFDKMKDDAILINTSKGAIIDEVELIQALRQNKIGGACLDVFEDEPIKEDNPLRDMDNVILTPHTAGLPNGIKYHRKRYEFFINNIIKVMKNEIPKCRLNIV